MKKYILSFFLIVIFGIYAFYQKMGGGSFSYVALNNLVTPPTTPAPGTTTKSPTPIPVKNPSPTPKPTPTPTPTPTPAPVPPPVVSMYRDGTYTGSVADAYYGNIQVSATISGGKITDVVFLQYPNDRGTSIEINTQAMPYLKSEAITVQSANVDGVSGATQTSVAFIQSLESALAQAKN